MILTGTFYLTAETERFWISTNPETVSLNAYNVQAAPLDIRFWSGEGSNKTAMSAYLTLCVESAYSEAVAEHYRYDSPGQVSSYSYTIPSDKYPTANRISIYAYEDAARKKEIDSKQVNIIVASPTPFPRSESWSAKLVFKNGEYLMGDNDDDVLYMWTSRVPGNTTTDPKTWIQNNPNSGLWTPYPYSTLLAGRIILGKFGMIDSAVFQNGYMISQQGTDASGNPTEDYRKFGTNAFTPNLMLNFKTGDCELSGSIRRGIVIIDSDAPHQGITKNNIYVCKSDSNTLITLFFSSGSRSFGTEFSIINGGTGVVSISYITNLAFLFKGKQYSIVKLNKPGDIAEFIFSPMTHNAAPNMSVALVLKNKSDFKASSDGITLESI